MLKKMTSKCIALMLVIALLIPMFAFPVSAAASLGNVTLNFLVNGGSYQVTVSGTKSYSNYEGELIGNDTEKSIQFSGQGNSKSNTIALTMNIPANSVLDFDYEETIWGELTSKYYTFTSDGTGAGDVIVYPENGGHYSIRMGSTSSNITFRYMVKKGTDNEFVATLKNMTLSKSQNYSVTVNGSANGTVSVGGQDLAEGGSVVNNVTSSEGLYLDATPANGYTFAGYSVNGSDINIGSCSTDADNTNYHYTYFPDTDNVTLTPVFVPKEGTDRKSVV